MFQTVLDIFYKLGSVLSRIDTGNEIPSRIRKLLMAYSRRFHPCFGLVRIYRKKWP